MKKNLYVKLGLIAGTFLTAAVPSKAHSGGIRSGFYGGASVGLSHLSGSQNFDAAEVVPAPATITDVRKNSLSATSVAAAVFGGYGYKINCTWVAAELSYLFDQLNGNRTAQFGNFTHTKTFQSRSTGGAFGLAFHLGYIPQENCLVYAIAGLEARRFQMGFQSPTPNGNFPPLDSKKYTSVAFAPGLGLLFKITKNVSLRGEYKYAFHKSKTITASTTNAIAGTTNTSTLRQTPRVQTFQIGFVYNF